MPERHELRFLSVCLSGTLLLGGACGGDGGAGPTPGTGSLQVVQAAPGAPALDVLVDGEVVIRTLAAGTLSPLVPVRAGQRTVEVRPTGGAASPRTLQLAVAADARYTAVVIDSSTVLAPIALTDTGSVTAPGTTKLRVANFAALAGPIDVYRRQPDVDGLFDVMFPFEYRAVSPYLQSGPGDWQVLVATESRVGGVPPDVPRDTLLIVEPITLATGQVATVVFVDKAGGGIDALVTRDR